MVNCDLLKPSCAALAKAYLKDSKLEESSEWMRFWNNREIQLDGTFNLEELQELVKLLEFIKD